ncbi:MAG: CpsD/CapB family tyrosine-protein kinase [Magnetococcus sp. DMHC-1]|nr:CpsD/CapB family tyrosine-protein kinase [Magnetococcales bacterium]
MNKDPTDMIWQIVPKLNHEMSRIRGNLLSASEGKDLRTLIVSSALPKEGKTTTAVALAYGLVTQANTRVVLVDGNDKSPALARVFQIPETPGLVGVLTGTASLETAVCETHVPGLKVLPFGDVNHRGDLFSQTGFKELITRLRDTCDYVILDSSSLMTSSGATLATADFQGVILVIRCESTKRVVVHESLDLLRRIHGNVLGVVLNRRVFHIPRFVFRWL